MFVCTLLTLFPQMFPGPLGLSLAGDALARGLWSCEARDIREHGLGRHHAVDDTPAGGGPGMVMRADVLAASLDAALAPDDPRPRLIMSPRGEPFTQRRAREWAAGPGLVIVCPRFEGADERIVGARGLVESRSATTFFRAARLRRSRCSTPASGCFPALWGDPNRASRRVSRRAGSNIPITHARVNGRGGAFPTCCCPAITRASEIGGGRRRSGSRGSGGPIFASDEIRRLSFWRGNLDRRIEAISAAEPPTPRSLRRKDRGSEVRQIDAETKRKFASERENFACERKTFRFGARKPLILLGY